MSVRDCENMSQIFQYRQSFDINVVLSVKNLERSLVRIFQLKYALSGTQ